MQMREKIESYNFSRNFKRILLKNSFEDRNRADYGACKDGKGLDESVTTVLSRRSLKN